MARTPKTYTIIKTKFGYKGSTEYEQTGTLKELIEAYGYTLYLGKEHEYNGYKINTNPKGIKALVNTLE